MAAAIEKNIGQPRTISSVQMKRKLLGVQVQINDAGKYSVVIIYREYEVDGNGEVVGSEEKSTIINDAQLGAAAKAEIDSIFTRALAAI